MPSVIEQRDIVRVNSTSYIDMLGVLVGLRRFTGETTDEFRDRLWRAVSAERGPQYRGLLNELNLQLGLQPTEILRIWNLNGDLDVSVSLAGIKLASPGFSTTIPLLSVDGDDMWVWKKHSELASAINASGACYAELLGEDGPALQLMMQSNVRLARNEPVRGAAAVLENSVLIPGTEVFSGAVPDYAVAENKRVLVFDAPVPEGTTVTYRYRICPYTAVASQVGLLNLLDPAFAGMAVTDNNRLVYQVREYLQEVMLQDRSYWGA